MFSTRGVTCVVSEVIDDEGTDKKEGEAEWFGEGEVGAEQFRGVMGGL